MDGRLVAVDAQTLHDALELVDAILGDSVTDQVLGKVVIRTSLSNVSSLRGAVAELRVHHLAPA